jgi:restriction endonuclease S subunit
LNSASLSLLEIPLPPLAEQTRIIQKTTQLLDLVSRLENYTER